MDEKIVKLQELIDQHDNIVFFGGAGVSTESGIPDFRSQDGLYHQKYDFPPETILSHTFFLNHPEEFYKFYRDKMLCDTAKPNAAHLKLAELEEAGKLKRSSHRILIIFIRWQEVRSSGTSWKCLPQSLHALWKIFRFCIYETQYRSTTLRVWRNDQTGCGTL